VLVWDGSGGMGGVEVAGVNDLLGYVSRAGPKDNGNHVILGTQVRQVFQSLLVEQHLAM
jgi:hypothetical protein